VYLEKLIESPHVTTLLKMQNRPSEGFGEWARGFVQEIEADFLSIE
jgi:hypothetical protein